MSYMRTEGARRWKKTGGGVEISQLAIISYYWLLYLPLYMPHSADRWPLHLNFRQVARRTMKSGGVMQSSADRLSIQTISALPCLNGAPNEHLQLFQKQVFLEQVHS